MKKIKTKETDSSILMKEEDKHAMTTIKTKETDSPISSKEEDKHTMKKLKQRKQTVLPKPNTKTNK